MKPMLACNADISKLQFPLLASPKLDGIRALVKNGILLSRTLKPIPNPNVQNKFKNLEGFDGELIFGNPTDTDIFKKTTSIIMTEEPEINPIIDYYVFDMWNRIVPFKDLKINNSLVKIVEQILVNNLDELNEIEEKFVNLGYEGIMVRNLNSPYKFGRSTIKEGYLLKIKRFEDSEAKIININELYHNNNKIKINELGNSSRSSHKDGLIESGKMGSISVIDIKTNIKFEIGTGFNEQQRQYFWKSRDNLIGKIITYKYQIIGAYEKPRFPVYKGFRLD